jgi:hypothetical protein
MAFAHRAIQLGEILFQVYPIHLKQLLIYPKIVVCVVAALCEMVEIKYRAKQVYQKAAN